MKLSCFTILAALAGCITPEPPAQPDLAPRAMPAPPPSEPPPLPKLAEVEMSGELVRPAGMKKPATIWVTDGPCFAPGTRALGSSMTPAERWGAEVFVPQGTNLWVCAAIVEDKQPIRVYGAADRGPLLGKGAGEVMFSGLKIVLKSGHRVSVPPTAPPPPR